MIEQLESRIAPAAMMSFIEADGDKVIVTTTKGTKAGLNTVCGNKDGTTGASSLFVAFISQGSTIATKFPVVPKVSAALPV